MQSFRWLIRVGIVTSLLVLGLPQVQAQDDGPTVYTIRETGCSFSDAIEAANQDQPVGACPAGNGADVIRLTIDVSLVDDPTSPPIQFLFPPPDDLDSLPPPAHYIENIPKITSPITIDGQGYALSIMRSTGFLGFNILKTDESGNFIGDGALTLKNMTLTGRQNSNDMAVFNEGGMVELENVTVQYFNGGAVKSNGGEIQVVNSKFLDNRAQDGGAIYAVNTVLTIRGAEFRQNQVWLSSRGGYGGAIYLQDSTFDFSAGTSALIFDSNHAVQHGGAIFSKASSGIIQNATFQDNVAWGGGAIYHGYNAEHTLAIMDSRFYRNEARLLDSLTEPSQPTPLQGGGAILNEGQLSIERTVFWVNSSAGNGGAILHTVYLAPEEVERKAGVVLVNSSSFIANVAGRGGAFFLYKDAQITNSTIYSNLSWMGDGGGVVAFGQVNLFNTIISTNLGGDCVIEELWQGAPQPTTGLFLGDHNLDSDGSCPSSDRATGLEAQPMHNGGGTVTIALLEGSNAIDAGNPDYCAAVDQRGAPIIGICDIGALEFNAMALPDSRDPNGIDETIKREQETQARNQEYDQRLTEMTVMIEADPSNAVLYVERGAYRMGSKSDFDGAIADFEQALLLDPTCTQAQFFIASIYVFAYLPEHCTDAREELDQFISIAPGRTVDIQNLETQFNRGCATSGTAQ